MIRCLYKERKIKQKKMATAILWNQISSFFCFILYAIETHTSYILAQYVGHVDAIVRQ